jgi:hypothetical protein
VREADGSPSGRPINTIVVSNGDLSISGTIATIDTSGTGTIGGTIADTQVAFGSAADTIKGNSKFRFLESAGQLILTGTGDDNAEFLIERSSGSNQTIGIENDSSASPVLRVRVPPNNAKELQFDNQISDTAVTGGTQGFRFNIGNTADTTLSMLTIGTTDSVSYDVVFNEDSLNDYDVRIEGATDQNLFIAKGSEDAIGIGTSPSTGTKFHIAGGDVKMEADDGTDFFLFDSSESKLTLTGDADNDVVLEVIGSDSASEAGPRFRITNDTGTDSAMDLVMDNFARGYLEAGAPGGVMRNVLQFGQMSTDEYEVVFNEDGLPADFRIEGDSKQNLFFLDGGDDRVGIGKTPTAGIFQVQGGNFYIGPATASGASEQTPSYHNGATALKNYLASNQSSGDQVSGIRVFGDNFRARGMMIGKMDDPTVDDTVTEQYLFGAQYGRSNTAGISAAPENGGTEYITVAGLGVAGSSSVVINEDSIDMDFRVESNGNVDMFKIDGGLNLVSVSAAPVSGGATFQVPDNTISHYCNVNTIRSDAVSIMVMVNEDNQGQMWVHDSASAHTLQLVEGGVKGQHFQFMSTDGDITIDPQGSDTLNGGTASITRSANYEIYTVFCYDTGKWALSNPS